MFFITFFIYININKMNYQKNIRNIIYIYIVILIISFIKINIHKKEKVLKIKTFNCVYVINKYEICNDTIYIDIK